MTKARVSIGTGTPTGEPASGPKGPYVSDDHDDEVAAAAVRRSSDEADERRGALPHLTKKRLPQKKGSSQS